MVIPQNRNLCNFWRPKSGFFGPKMLFFRCHSGPVGLQRGRFHRATGRSLQPSGSPVADQRGRYGKAVVVRRRFRGITTAFFAIFICHGFFSNNIYKTCRDRGIPNVNVMWTWRNRGGTGCGALNCRNNMAVSKKILKFAENMCLSHARMAGGRVAWSGCRT